MTGVPYPEPRVRYTLEGETWEVYGRPEPVGLTCWHKLRNVKTGKRFKATYRQICDYTAIAKAKP